MVKGHHLQLRCHLPLIFSKFKWCNIKAASAHHPDVQQIDELLANGATEPSNGGVGFYYNVILLPNHMGSL